MEADFSGYATKAGLACSDGRTIMPGAFQHQDTMTVPLVWQHGHSDPKNVLGHAVLEHRDDGVYTYGFFNETDEAKHAKTLLEHGDIKMLSIWANQLVEQSKRVMHGMIREVSLVLAGANPGALIENVTIRHSDGLQQELDDEAIIYTGLELEHSEETPELVHADDDAEGEKTVGDVVETMNEEQKNALYFLVAEAAGNTNSDAEHDDLGDADDDDTLDHGQKEGNEMGKANVFDQDGQKDADGPSISHSDIAGIVADATKGGSLKDAVESYALAHGINDIDWLFPEARLVTTTPEFFARRMEWVNKVLGGAHKSPFSRIKSWSADITFDEARALGYVKGNLKKEEFFGLARRTTTPQTIYKKQKLDRDDIIDITDFDVVTWLKSEMRVMLDEELARAILLGDGREVDSDDKISAEHIRPIAYDDELYTSVLYVDLNDASSSIQEVTDTIVANRYKYRGTGTPSFFTTERYIAQVMLQKDTLGRRIYSSLAEWANELRVSEIVPVEVMEAHTDIVGVIVNMNDYTVGADKGGAVAMFDDFDIDYNKYTYLIETRMSGCLTKLKSAMVVKNVTGDDTLVAPAAPVQTTTNVAITNQTGVTYKVKSFEGTPTYNSITVTAGQTVTATYPIVLSDGESVTIEATPSSGSYYFATSDDDEWTYTYEA